MEELCAVHAARIQDNVGALLHPVPVYDVIEKGSTHGEVHHWVEAQAFVDEAFQHLQLLKILILQLAVPWSKKMMSSTPIATLSMSNFDFLQINYAIKLQNTSRTVSGIHRAAHQQWCLSPAAVGAQHVGFV